MLQERQLIEMLNDLDAQPNTTADWRDLYETVEAYKKRRLCRAIDTSPKRDEILASIQRLAGVS